MAFHLEIVNWIRDNNVLNTCPPHNLTRNCNLVSFSNKLDVF
jgi:hypothetical protein